MAIRTGLSVEPIGWRANALFVGRRWATLHLPTTYAAPQCCCFEFWRAITRIRSFVNAESEMDRAPIAALKLKRPLLLRAPARALWLRLRCVIAAAPCVLFLGAWCMFGWAGLRSTITGELAITFWDRAAARRFGPTGWPLGLCSSKNNPRRSTQRTRGRQSARCIRRHIRWDPSARFVATGRIRSVRLEHPSL